MFNLVERKKEVIDWAQKGIPTMALGEKREMQIYVGKTFSIHRIAQHNYCIATFSYGNLETVTTSFLDTVENVIERVVMGA